MSTLKLTSLIIVILISFSLAQAPQKNIIKTSGKVELQIPADVMSLSFNVVGKGSSLRAALISAKRKVGSIAKELIKLGLEEEDISTEIGRAHV